MKFKLGKLCFVPRAAVVFYSAVLLVYFSAGIARADQSMAGVSINPTNGAALAPPPPPQFNQAPPRLGRPRLTGAVVTNFPYVDAALLQSNSIPTNDPAAKWFLSQIETTKHQLQDTNLLPQMRQLLEHNLDDLQFRLDQHLNQVKLWQDATAKLRANPSLAHSNIMNTLPDPIVMSMSDMEAHYQREAANTNLLPSVRQANERIAENIQSKIEDHEKDAQLWENLHDAQASGNQNKVAVAKQALATTLAAKLGAMQGKTYPTNMSLDAVMAAYNKQIGFHWSRSDTIRSVVLAVLLIPLMAMAFLVVKKRVYKG